MQRYLVLTLLTFGLAVEVVADVKRVNVDGLTLTRIDHEIIINATTARVWAGLTTSEGLKGWIAPESRVELKPGGVYELYFWPKEKDRGMEGTKIVSFVPGEMLSYTGEDPGTWVVWRLEAVSEDETRLRFSGLGSGASWEKRVPYFDKAMPDLLQRLGAWQSRRANNGRWRGCRAQFSVDLVVGALEPLPSKKFASNTPVGSTPMGIPLGDEPAGNQNLPTQPDP